MARQTSIEIIESLIDKTTTSKKLKASVETEVAEEEATMSTTVIETMRSIHQRRRHLLSKNKKMTCGTTEHERKLNRNRSRPRNNLRSTR